MTVNKTNYYNWQKPTAKDKVAFRKASPNLVQIKDYLIKRWSGSNVGIFNRREIRGGGSPSSHSFGAALDWRYGTRARALAACKFLVANSEELGVQMVIDYVGASIWTPSAGWKKMTPNPKTGVGASWAMWLHVETTRTDWKNNKPVVDRIKA